MNTSVLSLLLLVVTLLPSHAAAQNTADDKKHSIRKIRFVTPDVAIVDIDNEVHGVKAMPAGVVIPPGGVLKSQLMQVFVRRGGEWWVEAYHNVDTKPGK